MIVVFSLHCPTAFSLHTSHSSAFFFAVIMNCRDSNVFYLRIFLDESFCVLKELFGQAYPQFATLRSNRVKII